MARIEGHTRLDGAESREILKNAQRLLADSEALNELGRFQSAIGLAVLAIEECGKVFILRWANGREDDSIRKITVHTHKQRVAGSVALSELYVRSIIEWTEAYGFELIHKSKMTNSQKEWLASPRGQDFNRDFFSGRWLDELHVLMAQKAKSEGIDGILSEATAARLSQLKNAAFYRDVGGGDLTDRLAPRLDKHVSEQCISLGRMLLRRVEGTLSD
ncbi:MAG: AbiV family abortive infection protein [Alphaproteobacteria bacterium]